MKSNRWSSSDKSQIHAHKNWVHISDARTQNSISEQRQRLYSVCSKPVQLQKSKHKRLVASTGKGLKVNHQESADRQKENKEDIDTMSVTIV